MNMARPHLAGSRKYHVRGPHLKAGVASITIVHGTAQKIPHVCEVISGLYCSMQSCSYTRTIKNMLFLFA